MKLKLLILLLILLVDGCQSTHYHPIASSQNNFIAKNYQPEPLSPYGNPECYDVDGQKYFVLKSADGYCKTGLASWYGTKFHGRNTSSREPYNMFALTAASRNLPLPTYVEVTNLENGKKIIVKVNDRGPFKSDRIIDLSYAAATKLGFANKGTANVQVKALKQHRAQSNQLIEEMVLANQGDIPEITINPIALPLPQQSTKSIALARYVQVGAFANHENAIRLKQQLTSITQAGVFINEGIANQKPIYRVQIGPFKTVTESEDMMTRLKSQGQKNVLLVYS